MAYTILCIEAKSSLRDVWAEMLATDRQFMIYTAHEGLEGLLMAQHVHPDVIIMGLRLPGIDGFDTIAGLRRNPITAETPIIVISAWSTARHKARALAMGANEHLTPPVNLPRLLRSVHRHLTRIL